MHPLARGGAWADATARRSCARPRERAQLRYPYESNEARQLNTDIFETIYFAAMTASMEMAQKDGPYETYAGSPVSQGPEGAEQGARARAPALHMGSNTLQLAVRGVCVAPTGIFQFDMWNVKPSARWDWKGLKEKVLEYGVRNSLLVAPMPTASTAQILGNNESFEPYTSNIYSRCVPARRRADGQCLPTALFLINADVLWRLCSSRAESSTRRTLSGEFQIVNQHLLRDLTELDLWDSNMRNKIIAHNGSIQVGLPMRLGHRRVAACAHGYYGQPHLTGRARTHTHTHSFRTLPRSQHPCASCTRPLGKFRRYGHPDLAMHAGGPRAHFANGFSVCARPHAPFHVRGLAHSARA